MTTIQKINNLAKKFNITLLYVFGSSSNEIYNHIFHGDDININIGSDIDFGVLYNKNFSPSVKDKVQLSIKLGEIFPSAEIDLINISEAHPFLAVDIIKGKLIFCSDDDFESEYELYVLRRAGDLAYFEKEKRKMIFGDDTMDQGDD